MSRTAPQRPALLAAGQSAMGPSCIADCLYLFVGPEEQKNLPGQSRSLKAPRLSGNDAVLAFDRGQMQMGRREFGGFYDGRIFLFTSNETLDKFNHNPRHYADEARAKPKAAPRRGNALELPILAAGLARRRASQAMGPKLDTNRQFPRPPTAKEFCHARTIARGEFVHLRRS